MKLAWPETQNRFQKESFASSFCGEEPNCGVESGCCVGTSCALRQLREQPNRTRKKARKRPMVRDGGAGCQRKTRVATRCSRHCNRAVIFGLLGNVTIVDS